MTTVILSLLLLRWIFDFINIDGTKLGTYYRLPFTGSLRVVSEYRYANESTEDSCHKFVYWDIDKKLALKNDVSENITSYLIANDDNSELFNIKSSRSFFNNRDRPTIIVQRNHRR
jgi:hypothetical protein